MSPENAIQMRCVFDHSQQHQPVLNGKLRTPADVQWGKNTFDEMCLGLLYVTLRSRRSVRLGTG